MNPTYFVETLKRIIESGYATKEILLTIMGINMATIQYNLVLLLDNKLIMELGYDGKAYYMATVEGHNWYEKVKDFKF